MKSVSKFVDKHWYSLSMLLIFSYTIFSGAQTICYSDEGYFGTAFQNFFDAHESTYTTDSYYLSIFVGAIWNKLFGGLGILSFTILAGITSCVTFHFVQKVLVQISKDSKWLITAGFFATLLYGFTYLFNNIHLTCLLLSIESYLLYEAYKGNSYTKLFVASFLGVLNVFTRIPNVTLLLLLLLPVMFCIIQKRKAFLFLINAACGGALALVLMIVLMSLLGHLDYFYKATIENLAIEATSGEESIHSMSSLLTHYIKDYTCVFLLMIIVGIVVYVKNRIASRQLMLLYSLAICFLMLVAMYLLRKYVYPHSFNYIIFSTALFCMLRNIVKKKYSSLFLSLLSIGIAILMPLGTDAGIASVGGFSSMFMLPLAMTEVHSETSLMKPKVKGINIIFMATIFLAFILLRFADMVAYGTWAEGGTRLKKTYLIHNSKYSTTYVSKERADEIDPVLLELNKYVKEGNYLFCFKDIPIFNYLTNTKPYAYCSEPGFISPGLFKYHICKAEKEIAELPVILREKELVQNPGWKRHAEVCDDFVKRHNYEVVWSSEKFEILISKNKRIK